MLLLSEMIIFENFPIKQESVALIYSSCCGTINIIKQFGQRMRICTLLIYGYRFALNFGVCTM